MNRHHMWVIPREYQRMTRHYFLGEIALKVAWNKTPPLYIQYDMAAPHQLYGYLQ